MSFAAIAQFAPAFFGGLMLARRQRARCGARHGAPASWSGPTRCSSLARRAGGRDRCSTACSGIDALQPAGAVRHRRRRAARTTACCWSLAVNTLFFVSARCRARRCRWSASRRPCSCRATPTRCRTCTRFRTAVTVNDLKDTISRYLGVERTERSFQTFEANEGGELDRQRSRPASDVIRFSEQLLASAVGSSSARLILSLLFQRGDTRLDAMRYRLLDDATEALHHNRDLLQIALDQMEQGITVFDQRFPPDLLEPAVPRAVRPAGRDGPGRRVARADILRFLARRGDIAGRCEVAGARPAAPISARPGRWS